MRNDLDISKGHKNYELMLCGLDFMGVVDLELIVMVASCRHSMGESAAMPLWELSSINFDPREKFWTRFLPEGSKVTPPHSSSDFRWKDYFPMVFRNDAPREQSSRGKGESFFYLTQDDHFMIKTVKK
ncbi:hypothetical protein GUJ93_ZPchr0007g4152 [Zizania palustris]|uniref:1-phosphatidylinositol-4-phosphate 5-kinase n=1 Tax=Zizania palustris TaxID=103762 RepID=A0A8J5VSA3_ZIZPA|nr:hypothetical protein GUJ93_ZPchr0007g4152 [Zizania palustris]